MRIMALVFASALAVCFVDVASAATRNPDRGARSARLGPGKVVPRLGLAIAAAVRKFKRSAATFRSSSSSGSSEPPRP